MRFSLRRTAASAVATLLVVGAVGVSSGALAGQSEDAQLLSIVNQMRGAAGVAPLAADAAAAAAAGASIGSLLTGGTAPTNAELSASVGPSAALGSVVLTGVDVFDAAELAFSEPATAATLTDPAFTGAGLASGFSATGDFIALAVLRTPAPLVEPTPDPTPPTPQPTAEPTVEPTVEPTSPAPSPEVTTPAPQPPVPAAGGAPAADPSSAEAKGARAIGKAAAKADRFGKFSGDKASHKLEKLDGWLDRKLDR